MRDLRCLGGVHRLSWIAVAFSSYDFISIRANRRPFLCGGAKAAEEFDEGTGLSAFQIRSNESGGGREEESVRM